MPIMSREKERARDVLYASLHPYGIAGSLLDTPSAGGRYWDGE